MLKRAHIRSVTNTCKRNSEINPSSSQNNEKIRRIDALPTKATLVNNDDNSSANFDAPISNVTEFYNVVFPNTIFEPGWRRKLTALLHKELHVSCKFNQKRLQSHSKLI